MQLCDGVDDGDDNYEDVGYCASVAIVTLCWHLWWYFMIWCAEESLSIIFISNYGDEVDDVNVGKAMFTMASAKAFL